MQSRDLLVKLAILSQVQEFSDETDCDPTAKNIIELFAGANAPYIEKKFFSLGHDTIIMLSAGIKEDVYDFQTYEDRAIYLKPTNSGILAYWYENKVVCQRMLTTADLVNILPTFPSDHPKIAIIRIGKPNFPDTLCQDVNTQVSSSCDDDEIIHTNESSYPVKHIYSHTILDKVKSLCNYNFQAYNFFEEFKLAEQSTHSIIQSFFSHASTSLIFYFKFNSVDHAFIIEKRVEGTNVAWVIYQSWFLQFSLFEWMGLSEIDDADYTPSGGMDFEKYGKGKRLNAQQILSFINDFDQQIYLGRCHHVNVETFSSTFLDNSLLTKMRKFTPNFFGSRAAGQASSPLLLMPTPLSTVSSIGSSSSTAQNQGNSYSSASSIAGSSNPNSAEDKRKVNLNIHNNLEEGSAFTMTKD